MLWVDLYMDIETDFVEFGDVCRNRVGITCQHGYMMLEGYCGYPVLKDGLRIIGDERSYHSLKIHKDDVQTFIDRVTATRSRYCDKNGD